MSRNQYTVARKSVWYVLRTLLAIVVIIVLAFIVFVEAMYISNIYILVTEGMEARAECILQNGSTAGLTEYFTQDFVALDHALYDGAYSEYTISNFLYKLQVQSIVALPWDNTASVRVTERMLALSGKANEGAPSEKLPAWVDVRYRVKLSRMQGRWYISDIILLEENPVDPPKPTPNLALIPQ
ncbi:MAG: hypothetical protein LBN26_05550 [Christensenellaceae bacterium]|jgi:hypothetical protein|nr:hypothetical protein [Christensenellaceae bacterium]